MGRLLAGCGKTGLRSKVRFEMPMGQTGETGCILGYRQALVEPLWVSHKYN